MGKILLMFLTVCCVALPAPSHALAIPFSTRASVETGLTGILAWKGHGDDPAHGRTASHESTNETPASSPDKNTPSSGQGSLWGASFRAVDWNRTILDGFPLSGQNNLISWTWEGLLNPDWGRREPYVHHPLGTHLTREKQWWMTCPCLWSLGSPWASCFELEKFPWADFFRHYISDIFRRNRPYSDFNDQYPFYGGLEPGQHGNEDPGATPPGGAPPHAVVPIPEPGTAMLLGAAVVACLLTTRWRRRRP